jgi:hypothetical protein
VSARFVRMPPPAPAVKAETFEFVYSKAERISGSTQSHVQAGIALLRRSNWPMQISVRCFDAARGPNGEASAPFGIALR